MFDNLRAGFPGRWGSVHPALVSRRGGRFLHLMAHRFVRDGGLHHTASLTYTTLLSLVPLMTVSLALFSAFPVSERVAEVIQDFIFKNFVPASGEVVRTYLAEFSQKASRLTGAGSLFLVIVAVLMMANIDQALNALWRVRRRRRPLGLFLVYWAVLSLGPLLMGVSVALTSYLVSTPLVAGALEGEGGRGLLELLPALASALAFTLLYLLVPNRHVPARHAVLGGLLAAGLFELAKHGFALFLTTFPTYQAIYGALATVPVFLIWIYLCWLVTLLGAEFTYCLGIYRDDWRPGRGQEGSDLLLAYGLLGHLWAAQRAGLGVPMERLLTLEPGQGEEELERVLIYLESARLVLRSEQGDWVLARDLGRVSLLDLYQAGPFLLPQAGARVRPGTPAPPEELKPVLAGLSGALAADLSLSLASLYEGRGHPETSG